MITAATTGMEARAIRARRPSSAIQIGQASAWKGIRMKDKPLARIPASVMQRGVHGSHHGICVANQHPYPKCDCFWVKQWWVSKPDGLQSNRVPVEPLVN